MKVEKRIWRCDCTFTDYLPSFPWHFYLSWSYRTKEHFKWEWFKMITKTFNWSTLWKKWKPLWEIPNYKNFEELYNDFILEPLDYYRDAL